MVMALNGVDLIVIDQVSSRREFERMIMRKVGSRNDVVMKMLPTVESVYRFDNRYNQICR